MYAGADIYQEMGSQARKGRLRADGCLGYMAQWRPKLENPLREASYDLSGGRYKVSMTCLCPSHPPCSHNWDGAQSLLSPGWYSTYIWVRWRGCWCYGAGFGVPSWCCILPWLTCLDDLAVYAYGASSLWCWSNNLSVQFRPNHTYREYCTATMSSVPGYSSLDGS
jgi:hypothetical protein